jgi:kynurenine formamidase
MQYRDLPDGDARGLFGEDDALGALNRQTPETIRAARDSIETGAMFSLNAPLNWPDPPLFNRAPVEHSIYTTGMGNRDDYLDKFYLQASSQWDSFQHFRDPEIGFYNHLPHEDLGIEKWAQRGIAGRAVLLDIDRYLSARGPSLRWNERAEITVDVLEAVRAAQGVEPREADILLIRTGWTTGYQAATAGERELVRTVHDSPGLEPSLKMIEYLWDWGVSAIAADNIAVEPLPIQGAVTLHARLLSRLGVPFGELWWLDELAAHSATDGRYTSFLTSAPLHLVGGVGSPANVLAIK